MIRFHIGSTEECEMIFKLERFFHLLDMSFELGSSIELKALS